MTELELLIKISEQLEVLMIAAGVLVGINFVGLAVLPAMRRR